MAKPGPRNSKTSTFGSRVYTHPVTGERFTSVTTILSGGIPKPALVGWAAKSVAEFAAANHSQIAALVGKGEVEAAVDLLKRSPYRQRDAAADVGSAVHAATEARILGEPLPDTEPALEPFMAAYQAFLDDCDPLYEASEASVYSRQFSYAGTLDAIATIDGRKLLIDVKTGKDVYAEAALQLAAYRYADIVLLPDHSEVAVPEVQGAAVLHLRPNQYRLIPVRTDEEVFNMFLIAKEVYEWSQSLSKEVIGTPLYPQASEISPLFPARGVTA